MLPTGSGFATGRSRCSGWTQRSSLGCAGFERIPIWIYWARDRCPSYARGLQEVTVYHITMTLSKRVAQEPSTVEMQSRGGVVLFPFPVHSLSGAIVRLLQVGSPPGSLLPAARLLHLTYMYLLGMYICMYLGILPYHRGSGSSLL